MNNSDDKAVYITAEGLAKIKEELEWRENERLREIADQIESTRKEGDISENAGYDEAKYQAGMNEGRVNELKAKIKYAVIIEKTNGPADAVELGRTVTVQDLEFGDEEKYTIVGSAEADPSKGRISNESPMGVSLMGRRIGDKVKVQSPGGQLEFKLLNIEYNWFGEPSGLCVHTASCGTALAMEFNGDVYACDHFVEPDHLRGNIHDRHLAELVAMHEQVLFGNGKQTALPRYCVECDVRFACHGGCPKDRIVSTPDGEPGLNYLCPGYKAFFHHVDAPMKRMCELLRQDRAPAEIVAEHQRRLQ